MRYGVIADIHGNLEALQAVLDQLDGAGVEQIICAGDIVGYGASPKECIRITRKRAAAVVAGNHDWAVAGKVDTNSFNGDAKDSVDWTRDHLSPDEIAYLGQLPLTVSMEDIALVHSSLCLPEYFGYIQTLYDAQLCFQELKESVAFVGHSHAPVTFLDGNPIEYFVKRRFTIPADRKSIINVGSVGQPRDMDYRACYVIFDSDTGEVTLNRVDYDRAAAVEAILDAELPVTNAYRLQLGR